MSPVPLNAVAALLAGTPVQLDEREVRRLIDSAVVLVTGAAGSIGSELCRQIARFGAHTVVGFDIAESALFYLDREMKATFRDVAFVPAVGSVQNRARLDEVFRAHEPSVVYHAAAYKHVPMMEAHVVEAVENNVFGTLHAAQAAAANGAAVFAMISSDKAVHPVSVMGATKRAAEMLLCSLRGGTTRLAPVRFGNVLGSSGSVVPLFNEQIAAGGPVTVTDPRMERYFMTAAESAQLVLQASAMAEGGEIFILDMGAPVKIVDLARDLIRLAGHVPDREIGIEFIGIRPGEKLREELRGAEEKPRETGHPRIQAVCGPPDGGAILRQLDALACLCRRRDEGAIVELLQRIVPDYRPVRSSGKTRESSASLPQTLLT
ncbi:MAG TPA: SDR family NAD(P)-dependent oxidoreductase [Bryobacteraceae bacterium]|nr:SDR family NAD(P)-dependent oxidoreductase [Bryobacteraceae bacterium]